MHSGLDLIAYQLLWVIFFLKNSSNAIYTLASGDRKRDPNSPEIIRPKVNVLVKLEIEISHLEAAV